MKLMILLLLSSFGAQAKIIHELVQDNLGIVWGMDFDGDDLYFSERSGKIKKINLKTKKITEYINVPKVYARGQGGLMDLKLAPDFSESKRIFFTYSKKMSDGQTTALGTAILGDKKLEEVKDLYVGKGPADGRRHFGSRITFDGKGHLFFSIGDRANRENPQKLDNSYGKIFRLNLDGSIPKENPFVGKEGALGEIWSYGHRNPQGLFYDKKTKTLYEIEHGPRGGDEINIIKKGANYGWPVISYGKEYFLPMDVGEGTHKEGMEQPLIKYVPSIAPCGLLVYHGDKYPSLKGKILSGALKLTHINVVNQKGEEDARLFDDEDMRVRSLAAAGNQEIYFSTDGGKIFKLVNK